MTKRQPAALRRKIIYKRLQRLGVNPALAKALLDAMMVFTAPFGVPVFENGAVPISATQVNRDLRMTLRSYNAAYSRARGEDDLKTDDNELYENSGGLTALGRKMDRRDNRHVLLGSKLLQRVGVLVKPKPGNLFLVPLSYIDDRLAEQTRDPS